MALDRKQLRRYSIQERPSKVSPGDFAKPASPGRSFLDFLDSLPRLLQAETLRSLVETTVEAIRNGKPVLVFYGAHVVKTGLSPVFCQAIEKGWITYAATNGAGTIHDLELARFGRTSEDVAAGLEDGSFGMAVETGQEWNEAVRNGWKRGTGLGEALGEWISSRQEEGARCDSILASAHRAGRPVTAHAAIGTDVTHPHPEACGEAIGATSFRDFETLCERVVELNGGGVVINIGSAVILPEVFLKALAVARNLAGPVRGFTTANLDMIRHYRPSQNILLRPTQNSGQAFEIVGPHEILVPMLFQGICERMEKTSE